LTTKPLKKPDAEEIGHAIRKHWGVENSLQRSIAGKRLMAGWDTAYMEKVLFQV